MNYYEVNSNSNSHDNVYGDVIVAVHCHCESSLGSSDECSTCRAGGGVIVTMLTHLLTRVNCFLGKICSTLRFGPPCRPNHCGVSVNVVMLTWFGVVDDK